MIHHISTTDGVQKAILQAFEIIESRPESENTTYFNCTSSDELRKVVQKKPFSWTQNPEKLQHFQYEHVSDLHQLHEKIASCNGNLIVIEQLDHIVLQPGAGEYDRLNELLAGVLRASEHVILLDSWDYIDKYFAT